jgi:hypothetical protein
MTSVIAERIELLEQRLKQLKAKQQRIEGRQRFLQSRRARKDDTRRKILIGAIVLARIEQGKLDRPTIQSWLTEGLSRADDRALFDL